MAFLCYIESLLTGNSEPLLLVIPIIFLMVATMTVDGTVHFFGGMVHFFGGSYHDC